jgi:hypothetical protein
MPDQQITIDLTGLELSDEQIKTIEAAVQRAALAEVAKLPTFPQRFPGGLVIRPMFPGNPNGPFPLGVVIQPFQQQINQP